MFDFVQKLLGKSVTRPALCLALYEPQSELVDLQAGLDWILLQAAQLGLPEAEWVTLTYGGPDDLDYKTYKLASWMKRGRPLPAAVCMSIETGRFLDENRQGLTDYVWYACLSKRVSTFILCIDLNVCSLSQPAIENLVLNIQGVTRFEYGYSFEMGMERGPAFYVDGGTLNGDKYFSPTQIEEIAKWSHAIGECKKLGQAISDLLRDIYPLNFINPRHLTMQIKGRSLEDWIEADPRRGTLKPLTTELWTWQVPENRIQAIRKVLGSERLLVSWGGFNTPSGGPLGHTYGAKTGKPLPSPFNGLPLTEDEQRWVADSLAAMKPIFERYTAQKPKDFERLIGRREALFGKLLDTAFTAWSEDLRPDKASPELALQAFAATLGEHLVKHFDMAWYAVEDEYGRSLGVAHRGKDGAQTWSYPVDAVAKRIDRGGNGFVPGIVEAVGNEIERG